MGPHEHTGTATPSASTVAAFGTFFDAHVDEVYRFVHRRCRDHALAEDITQEVFMAAIRSTDDPATLTVGWLVTVARNRLLDVVRRDALSERTLRLIEAAASEVVESEIADRLRVEQALDQLAPDHRLVLTLHYIDGFTVPALADHVGRSVKSVEGLVTRARRELRARLGDEASTERGGRHA